MKKLLAILLCLVLLLALAACGSQSGSESEKFSKEEDTKITSEITTGSDVAKNESQIEKDASSDVNEDDNNASNEGEIAEERHYYSKVVITSTNLNIGDFIYGVDSALMDFGFFDGAAYSGYEPSFTIYYDTSTGKAVSGVLKGYVSSFGGNEGETDYEELYEEAISSSTELSGKIYGFSREVVERGDENYPIVTCISANVDVSEYWANFEQFICLYCIESTQDVEGLINYFMDNESNGVTVERGSNYIVDPIGGLKYEWFD